MPRGTLRSQHNKPDISLIDILGSLTWWQLAWPWICPLHTYGSIASVYFHYLLTPWSRVLLEKLTGSQLVKKFPAFYGTRRFITAFTSARHLPLSWGKPIQSIPSHPTSWRSILILSYHICLGLPSSCLPSGFLTKTLFSPLHEQCILIYV